MRGKIFFLLYILGSFILLSLSLQAEEENKTFYGNFLFGYRTVDTSGAHYKYKEDINLEDGVRLFRLNLHYTPKEKFEKLFDRIDLNVHNFGGDPYETLSLSIRKYGKYQFQFKRKKADYFYHDLHKVESGALYDLHTFNFTRYSDSGMLKILLGENVDVYLNFDRYTKEGKSTTTFDISRREFEFEKPLKEDSREASVGVNFHLPGYSLLLEEKIKHYENSNSFFLPGYAGAGEDAYYPTSLSYLTSNQPYDFKSYTHHFKLNARPFPSLLISGSAQLSDLDMDLNYTEEAAGINYLGRYFQYSLSGEGSFKRSIQLYDLDISYLLSNKVALVGAVRYHNFDQEGTLTVIGIKEDTALGFSNLGFEGGFQYQFSPELGLTLGYRNETRNLDNLETVNYEFETQRNGVFGNFNWKPSSNLKLNLDYQYGSFENPYTLISPTSFHRLTAKTNLKMNKFNFSGSYLFKESRSEVFNQLWKSTENKFSFRTGFNSENFYVSGGYSLIDIKHQGDRNVVYPPSFSGPGGTFLWEILYEGESHLVDLSLKYTLDGKWKIGGYGHGYWNKGFWEISRVMFKTYLEYTLNNGFISHLGYRYVNFKEKISGYNDYKAHIIEISFGYLWD